MREVSFKDLAEETLCLLRESRIDAMHSSVTRNEIMQRLNCFLAMIDNGVALPGGEIELLYGPTGCIQETAIDNGWEDKYLEISSKVDLLIGGDALALVKHSCKPK